ncbi:MAG: serine hydrolase, partial [Pseudomonadota bacterium]
MHRFRRIFACFALLGALSAPSHATSGEGQADFEASFDSAFGTEMRSPTTFEAIYSTNFEEQIADLADGSSGRIGVYAVDLETGEEISVLGDMRFPMASTSKVAVAATFLAGVDEGKYSLTSEYPLLIPLRSKKFSSPRAPVKHGNHVPAYELISLMISKSCNSCTDALLKVVGGPDAVNAWMREEAEIEEFELSRDIATLVRDDGEFDPVEWIDPRDSATPRAMGQLLAGLYQGRWLSDESRTVLIAAMEKTTTGR